MLSAVCCVLPIAVPKVMGMAVPMGMAMAIAEAVVIAMAILVNVFGQGKAYVCDSY